MHPRSRRALRWAKSEGLFDDNTLLIVGSSDPGPSLQRRAEKAVKPLNPPAIFLQWKAAVG